MTETNDNDDFTELPLPSYESLMAEENDSDDFTECVEHRLKYFLKDFAWFSKMLVDYKKNDLPKYFEVKDSENLIPIPNEATNIKVRFQAMRFLGIWSDVKKYDYFKKMLDGTERDPYLNWKLVL